MRIFLDTNVVVSAVATRGLCADLLVVILAEHDLMLGETVLTELKGVLRRKLGVPKERIRELDAFLRAQAAVSDAPTVAPHPSLDDADARVLAEALVAGADVLVTGDRDLLSAPSAGIEIVTPRGLWERLRRRAR